MARLTLELKDRIMLINQYEILKRLPGSEEIPCDKYIKILRNGFESEYGNLMEAIDPNPTPASTTCEVLDILDVYRAIQGSYKRLADQSGIDPRQLDFPGFSNNEESSQLAFMYYLHENDRFKELEPQSSHFPMMRKYRNMVAIFKAMNLEEYGSMTAEQIKQVLAADHSDPPLRAPTY